MELLRVFTFNASGFVTCVAPANVSSLVAIQLAACLQIPMVLLAFLLVTAVIKSVTQNTNRLGNGIVGESERELGHNLLLSYPTAQRSTSTCFFFSIPQQ